MKIQVLLLPARLRERPSAAFRLLRVTLVVLPFVAFAWIGLRYVRASRREEALDARLVPLRAERVRLAGQIKALLVPAAEADRVEASVAALNATTSAGAAGVLGALPALEQALPASAALIQLSAKPAGATVRLTLKGAAPDEPALAQVADRVSRVPGLRLRGWTARPTGGFEWTAEGDMAVLR